MRWGALFLAALATACTAPPQVAEAPPPADPAAYAGADTCTVCHEVEAASFAKTPHAWALEDAARPPSDRGCEACHGPGAAHAEAAGGNPTGTLRAFVRDEPAATRSAACQRCHRSAELQGFRGSEHAFAAVACTDCHRGHGGRGEAMLAEAPPTLCFGCHPDVRASFALPERHGPHMAPPDCTGCHDPHGRPNLASQREANDRHCLACHGDLAGPWVFEHGAQVVEGCTACHEPHGSVNRHLLLRQPVALLCYQCHTVTPSTHVQPSYRDCTRCHASIHGSNTDSHFLSP